MLYHLQIEVKINSPFDTKNFWDLPQLVNYSVSEQNLVIPGFCSSGNSNSPGLCPSLSLHSTHWTTRNVCSKGRLTSNCWVDDLVPGPALQCVLWQDTEFPNCRFAWGNLSPKFVIVLKNVEIVRTFCIFPFTHYVADRSSQTWCECVCVCLCVCEYMYRWEQEPCVTSGRVPLSVCVVSHGPVLM